ncbi:ComEC/Rec2 family competence protein [Priestia taiwanensis]|uniref:Competence protein ComE n=1 Tax=Priestia taiwanensis TaxID=1347902 RepID=A0A917AS86_9BACI|nr:ComEC/Rec2 family competence protein [Priestia taiwanensis]MBM7363910.1 beta-lactamase superfamily II metal-dependent hydrolase [Priestia taiwanensis]GGE70015.1 competence protein ComE [Priestia taiwanensis]
MWRLLMLFSVAVLCLYVPFRTVPAYENKEGTLQMTFFNVGQGDSTLIILPNGKKVLIDGGPPKAGVGLVQKLRAMGITSLDVVVGTHPDFDHIGGLLEVLKDMHVGMVVDSGKKYVTNIYYQYVRLIKKKKIPLMYAKKGQYLTLDPLVEMRVLNNGVQRDENNESSIVLKVSYKHADFLLTGDADIYAENQMMKKKYNLQADVLKVGHHGSYTSTSDAFLDHVHPIYAILSYQKGNPFGHPHQVVMRRLKEHEVGMYETAIHGDIEVETNGYLLQVEDEAPFLLAVDGVK